MQHTQGPWLVGVENGGGGNNVVAMSGLRVAHTAEVVFFGDGPSISTDEAKANARLIAAAPALLDAIERTLEHFADGLPDHLVDEFKECVAKATGGGDAES